MREFGKERARIVAKSAGHRSAYEWQYSLDPETWTAMPVTLQAKTDVSGLTSGTTYAFRFRPVLKTGEATWSQVVVQPIHQVEKRSSDMGRTSDAMGSSSPGLFHASAVLGGFDSGRRMLIRHRGKL
jgi:hypothetical protein